MASSKPLILASTSPFRQKLLKDAGIAFEAVAPEVDEKAILDPDPVVLARRRSEAKAMAVSAARPGAVVIGADQVLSLGREMFSKARTAGEARQRLAQLAGKTHHLHSGLALASDGRLLTSRVVSVAMPMRALTPVEVDAYVATGEWQGCVGCYQYENRGGRLFAGVTADESAIVGLPIKELLEDLKAVKAR